MTTVRTRFAPSPTGDLHIGGVRTALFSWLTAKHNGGQFFLRFEDTDQNRYVPGSGRTIIEQFKWLGIELDGGPDHDQLQKMKSNEDTPYALEDGSYRGIPGPFVQSQRLNIYKIYAEQLVANGKAYRCDETAEELDAMRKATELAGRSFIFKKHMRLRTEIDPAKPHVIRFDMPSTEQTVLEDMIRGRVVFENANLGDDVLLKSDGFPTYALAAMVDDHLMGVTHIIRSDEWLPSAPKHIHIIKALGWHLPKFAHVPTVNGEDGKKLSKRHGATGIWQFRDAGYVQSAIINFLAMLGWAVGEGEEQNVFTIDELIQKFSLDRVGSSPAIFSYPKLDWLNGVHIRRMKPDDLAQRLVPFLTQAGIAIDTEAKMALLVRIVPQIQERIKKLTEAPPFLDFFFGDIATPPKEMLIGPKMDQAQSVQVLQSARDICAGLSPFEDAQIELAMRALCAEQNLKPNQAFTIIRNAVTGKSVTPPLFATMALLGRDTVLLRLDRAIGVLGGK
jgi:glutamyl-tRNA synthetase